MSETRNPQTSGRTDETVAAIASPDPSSLDTLMWRLWPLMAWLFPVALFALLYYSDAGGWEMLFILMLSPVILPAYALLNLIPRRIIRKSENLPRGSTGLTCLLILHWWGLTIFALFFPGVGDSGGARSYLGEILRWLPPEPQNAISLLGAIVTVMTWIGLLVAPEMSPTRPATKRSRFWPFFAFVVPPLAVVLALTVVYSTGLNETPDAGGVSESQAQRVGVAEAREIQGFRWNELQEQLVPLRTSIAPSGWVAERNSRSHTGFISSSGLGRGFHLESFRASLPSYTVDTIWSTRVDEPFADARTRVRELAYQQGWIADETEQFTRLDDQGNEYVYVEELSFVDALQNRFHVSIELPRDDDGTLLENGTSVVSIRARSAEYWREGGFDFRWEDAATPAELKEFAGATFTSTDWPELRLFLAE